LKKTVIMWVGLEVGAEWQRTHSR